MDKFATLEPVRLYTAAGRAQAPQYTPRIGRLPVDVHALILSYCAVPDIASYACACRSLAALAGQDRVWEPKLRALGPDAAGVLDALEDRNKSAAGAKKAAQSSATLQVADDGEDDDFGDFTAPDALGAPPQADEMGDFVGAFANVTIVPRSPVPASTTTSAGTVRATYMRAHNLLRGCVEALRGPPHLVLGTLFPPPAPDPLTQAYLIKLLGQWLSPAIQPLIAWETLGRALRAAADRFDAGVLAAFDYSDTSGDETRMRAAAYASWAVSDETQGAEWELGRVWAEKRDVFYEQGDYKAEENVTCVRVIVFSDHSKKS
jgi:recyclin-1